MIWLSFSEFISKKLKNLNKNKIFNSNCWVDSAFLSSFLVTVLSSNGMLAVSLRGSSSLAHTVLPAEPAAAYSRLR